MFICKMTEALTARGAWERLEGYLGIRQVKQESEEIMPSVPYMYRHKIILFHRPLGLSCVLYHANKLTSVAWMYR